MLLLLQIRIYRNTCIGAMKFYFSNYISVRDFLTTLPALLKFYSKTNFFEVFLLKKALKISSLNSFSMNYLIF